MFRQLIMISIVASLAAPVLAWAGVNTEGERGTIFTLWPLVDYRESPREGYSNLSILGPVFKLQQQRNDREVALRPLFYRDSNPSEGRASTVYLYPLASSESSADVSRVQILQLFQNNTFRKDEGDKQERGKMLFPFYITGRSEKYGPYTSVFPLYGDLYERFWRDEYHYVLFPLYGKTVKKGTTTRNYIYPFFSTLSGEKEWGFQFWPLYGQSAKEGVYNSRFFLWPFFMQENSGLDTANPTRKFYALPLYAATDSPKTTARYYLWPFFGHKTDVEGNQEEWDYFWPFIRTVRGDKRNVTSFLPLFFSEERKETSKRWVMWPLLKHEEMNSDIFLQERDRILYFLYSDNREKWPKDGAERRRTKLWPFFVYQSDTRGVKSLSVPAPVEPILDREGIEKDWAPFWRLYQQRWDDNGDSAASLFWNLYWHEQRGKDLAFEVFPLVDYRSESRATSLKLFKGLVNYEADTSGSSIGLFWFPLKVHWGSTGSAVTAVSNTGSLP